MAVGVRRRTLRPPPRVPGSAPWLPKGTRLSGRKRPYTLSVNYDFYVNLTTFALQPARPRRDDARTPQPDDMGLSLSVAGPIQGVVSLGIV